VKNPAVPRLAVPHAQDDGVARHARGRVHRHHGDRSSRFGVEERQWLRLGRRVERAGRRRERPTDPLGVPLGERHHGERLLPAVPGVVEDEGDDAVDLGVGRVDRRLLARLDSGAAVDQLERDRRVENRTGRTDEALRVATAREPEEPGVRIPVSPGQPMHREHQREVLEQRRPRSLGFGHDPGTGGESRGPGRPVSRRTPPPAGPAPAR
jgi:hypothetical protein